MDMKKEIKYSMHILIKRIEILKSERRKKEKNFEYEILTSSFY